MGMKFPGYMTPEEALEHGFTHHGKYYGIPIWIGAWDTDCPQVATKVEWLEWLFTCATYVEGVIHLATMEEDPTFCFQVGAPIAGKS